MQYQFYSNIKQYIGKKVCIAAGVGFGVGVFVIIKYLIQRKQQNKKEERDKKKSVEIFSVPKESDLINKIYNQTCRARKVDPEFRNFVGQISSQELVLDEYGMNQEEIKQVLYQKLIGMRRVRGDGNCFYTSFGFQYLEFVLIKATQLIFDNFIKKVEEQAFIVILEKEEIIATDELKPLFIDFCQKIRALDKTIREATYFDLFSNPDGQLYGLTIIFLRNLAYNLCSNDNETSELFQILGFDMRQQILEWEYDCENNQSVIAMLSQNLNINISLFFIDTENYKVSNQLYKSEQAVLDINLLFRPGHYNIAIPK